MKRIFAMALAAALLIAALSACGSKEPQAEDKQVDLAAFAQTLKDSYEFGMGVERVDPADEFGSTMLDNAFPGLKDMDLEQMEVYLCMISFNTGEFALVQAKNADDAAKVKELFETRISTMTQEGMNYPETVEMWVKSAKVADHGSYVMLVCHSDADAIVEEFNALFQ